LRAHLTKDAFDTVGLSRDAPLATHQPRGKIEFARTVWMQLPRDVDHVSLIIPFRKTSPEEDATNVDVEAISLPSI
jgi:hypothetical protein